MQENTVRGALDFSWNEAAFALMRGNTVLLRTNRMFSGHDASALPEWLQQETAKILPEGLTAVQEWSVGAGPGSFSGLRIASALVMGLCQNRTNVRIRAVSTAAAIARTAFPDAARPEHVLVLFDGKRSEVIGSGLELRNGQYFPDGFRCVCKSGEELRAAAGTRAFCGLEKDSAVLAPFDVETTLVNSVDAVQLILNDPEDFSTPPTELEYLRAAVFVEPKTPRKIFA